MTDDPELIARQLAYIEEIRRVARGMRALGFVCCLAGTIALIFVSVKLEAGATSAPGYSALAVIMLGWALFVYAIVKRTRYVRAHPFDPKT